MRAAFVSSPRTLEKCSKRYAIKNNFRAVSKTVPKANPDEKVGVFCKKNGRPSVVEYTEISKEMAEATNENGEIWMIPVESAIFGLFYHKEYSATRGVDLSQMDLFDFLNLVEEIKTKEPEKGSLSTFLMIENFLFQYLSVYDSFDTEVFRTYAKQLRQIIENVGKYSNEEIIQSVKPVMSVARPNYTQEELEKIPNFLYQASGYQFYWKYRSQRYSSWLRRCHCM